MHNHGILSKLDMLSRVISKVSTALGGLGAGVIVFLLFLIVTEIMGRTFLQHSLLFTTEVSAWLVVSITFLGGAFALQHRKHIRLALLTSHLSRNSLFWLNLCLNLLAAVFFTWFAIQSWARLTFNFTENIVGLAIPHLPVFWPWTCVFVGSVVFAMQQVGCALEAIIAHARPSGESREAHSRRSLWLLVLSVLVFFGLIGILYFYSPTNSLILLSIMVLMILAAVVSGVWIYLSLLITGIVLIVVFTSISVEQLVPMVCFKATNSFILACLPLFILMGELLLRSGASNDLYSGISPWVERLPGRLLHSNVVACSIFAAISGSSAATTAFVGSVAIPELSKRKYDRPLTISSLAGAGTLGLLIPPSIMMIVYGAVACQSVGQLFIGGFLPGLTIAALFSLYILIRAMRNPALAPSGPMHSWGERIKGLAKILPVITLIIFVLGSIYAGIATPTEAAALGAFLALIVNAFYRRLNWPVLREALSNTLGTTSMILCITTGAIFLSVSLGYVGIPQGVAAWVLGLDVSKWVIFAFLCILYLGMGCFFDGISMILLTTPIILPTITALGFDLIWFGIILVILIEAAQITPPVGINLYILQNMTGEPIEAIAKWSIPFFLLLNIGIVILVFFPDLALFLPRAMMK